MENSIGAKIKFLRRKNKISQNELCGDLIDRSLLSKIENNHIEPSLTQLQYFASKLNVQLNYFFSELNYGSFVDNNLVDDNFLSQVYEKGNYEKIISLAEFNTISFNNIDNLNKYFYLGMSYFNDDKEIKSISTLKKYVNLYLKAEQSTQKEEIINFANALNTLSKIMLKISNYEKAVTYLHMARKYILIYNKSDSVINFIIHNNLGHAYNNLNQFNKCISVLEEFVNQNRNLCYLLIMPHIHWSLNIAYYNIEEYDKSIEHIQKCIYLFRYSDDHNHLYMCYINYINTLRYWGKFDKALDLIKELKSKYSSEPDFYNKLLIQEIGVYFNLNQFEDVCSLINGIQFNKLTQNNKYDYFFVLGHIHFLEKNYNKTIYYFHKCEKYFISNNYTYDLYLLYEELYEITNDKKYSDKINFYKNKIGRKNILVH